MQSDAFRSAVITPDEVLCSDSAEFVITLVVGPGYTDGPSRIIFDFPGTVGYSRPSRMHQEEAGYVEASVDAPDVAWEHRIWDMEGGDFIEPGKGPSWRGQAVRICALDLSAGLRDGDVVRLRWGAVGGGYGPGARVTHIVPRPDYADTVHVRYFDDPEGGLPDRGRSFEGYDRPEPTCEVPLSFRVRPREASRLRLLRTPTRAVLLPLDRFCNVTPVADADALVATDGVFVRDHQDAHVSAAPDIVVRSKTLPMTVSPDMRDVHDGFHLYWGDIHTHSSVSIDCVEREKMQMDPAALCAYARSRAALDFYAVTDHHQPYDPPRRHIPADDWIRTAEAVETASEPGAFLAFMGIEWRCVRGDTAVIFRDPPDRETLMSPELVDVRRLWEVLGDRDYLAVPHFHNPGGLPDGEWWRGPERVAPVLEIFSCHGSYEREDALEHHVPLVKNTRPDRYGAALLRDGHRYGFVCNSDGHKGHVGTNGVTAVFARELTPDAVFEAYRARRVYGTTNARIRLVFCGDETLMGGVLPNRERKTLHVAAVGEDVLKKVELFRDGEFHSRYAAGGIAFERDIVVEDAAPASWYVRVTQRDNHVAWSSPIWYE